MKYSELIKSSSQSKFKRGDRAGNKSKIKSYGRCFTRQNFTRQNLGGFTLIEMLVVLILVTAVSTVLIYRYGRLALVLRLDRTAQEVALAARKAQEYALASRPAPGSSNVPCAWGVRIDGLGSTYRIFPDLSTSCPGNGRYDGGEEASTLNPDPNLPKGIKFQGSDVVDITYKPPDPTVEIYVNNALSIDTYVSIVLGATGLAETRTVEIWKSGRISISR